MEEFLIFKIISFLLSVGVVLYGWRALKDVKTKVFLSASISLFFLSTVLFFEAGIADEWMKHVLFIAGEIFLYLFFTTFIKQSIVKKDSALPHAYALISAAPFFSEGTRDFFSYVTEQGFQHIITAPIIVLIIAAIRVQMIITETRDTVGVFRFFFLGLVLLGFIHVGEFFIESHGFFPFMEGDGIEIAEFLFYYSAMVLFCIGLNRNKKITI